MKIECVGVNILFVKSVEKSILANNSDYKLIDFWEILVTGLILSVTELILQEMQNFSMTMTNHSKIDHWLTDF